MKEIHDKVQNAMGQISLVADSFQASRTEESLGHLGSTQKIALVPVALYFL